MSSSNQSLGSRGFLYRSDIYLSLKDKNGIRVPYSKLQNIRRKIARRFGGITHTTIIGTPIYTGFWKSPKARKLVQDENTIYTTLTSRDDDAYGFFDKYKKEWLVDLNYEELLITVQHVEALPDE